MIAGILFNSWGWALISIAIGVLAFAILYFLRYHYVSFFFLMMSAGSALAYVNQAPQMPNEYLNKYQRYVAYVKDASDTDGGYRCILRIDSIDGHSTEPYECLAQLRGFLYSDSLSITKGATLDFSAKLQPLEKGDTTKRGTYNYDLYYASLGISAKTFINVASIRVLSRPNWIYRCADAVNRSMFNGIVFSPINGGSAAFLVASIMGNRSFLPMEQRDQFRATGIAHVLALSGLHVGIIVSLLSFVFFPLRLNRHTHIIQNLLTILLVWIYAFVTGLSPSVTRAAVMVSVLLLGYVVQRQVFTFNSLCLAAAIVLTIDPSSLFSAGFQMSFMAVASILLFMSILPTTLKRHPIRYYAITATMLPISAMLGTGIISAYYFGSIPLLFLFSNIIVGLLFPPLLILGVVTMLGTMAEMQFTVFGWLIDILHSVMQFFIGVLASWDATLSVSKFTAWAFIPYAASIVLLAYGLRLIVNDSDQRRKGHAMLIYSASAMAIAIVMCL